MNPKLFSQAKNTNRDYCGHRIAPDMDSPKAGRHLRKYGVKDTNTKYIATTIIDGILKRIYIGKAWNEFVKTKGSGRVCFTCKNRGYEKPELYWVNYQEAFKTYKKLLQDANSIVKKTYKFDIMIGKRMWYGIGLTTNHSEEPAFDMILSVLSNEKQFGDNIMFCDKENRDSMFEWLFR
jgi:hypothetical protein